MFHFKFNFFSQKKRMGFAETFFNDSRQILFVLPKKQSEAGKSLPYLPLAKYWNSKVCQQAIPRHKTNMKKMPFNV